MLRMIHSIRFWRKSLLSAALVLTSCTGNNDEPRSAPITTARASDTGAARGAPANDSAMAGMDHSKMDMGTPSTASRSAATGSAMAGMDHSTMAMPTPPSGSTPRRATPAGAGGMAGMDHSTMQMGTPRPAVRPSSAPRAGATQAMDHSTMPGMQATPPNPIDQKVQQLIAQLVQDSVVRSRIQSDTVLRNRWQDPDVRRILLGRP